MKFRHLPLIVKIAIILTFFNTWVMFEEFVVDKLGYWKFLPFYKKGIFCTWDTVFISITTILIFVNWNDIKSKCKFSNCIICKA